MSLLEVMVCLCLVAILCEWIDSSIGMGYGTILSPTLILLGFPALAVVPAILISQAAGGLCASYFHHKFENATFEFKDGKLSEDFKSVLWITSLGIVASGVAAFVGTVIPKGVLSTYIAVLVFVMGIVILIDFSFKYSSSKMALVGLVSAFNKGLSGGGFGPLVTGGQMVLGNKDRNTIGITTFAEGPICVAGFITYWVLNGIPRWDLVAALTIGSVIAGPIGAYTTMKAKGSLKKIIGVLLVVLGGLALLKTYGFVNILLSL